MEYSNGHKIYGADDMGCNKSPFTEEQKRFMKQNYKGISASALIDLLEAEYGIRFKEHQISHFKYENGLKSFEPLFRDEVIRYILQIYKEKSTETIATMVNEKFHTTYTVKQIRTFLDKRHLKTGYRRKKYQHGDEVVRDGYVYININGSFTRKDRYILECAGMEVEQGNRIKHLDGDQSNCELDNLAIISDRENLFINHNKLLSSDKEFNQCVVSLARLDSQVRDLQNKLN